MLAGIALVGMILAVTLKSYRAEFGILCSLAVLVFLALFALGQWPAVTQFIGELSRVGNLSGDQLKILLKSLGICIVVQLAADTCSDYGQSAIAAKLELAGKALLVITAMPLFTQLLSLVQGLL